MSAADEWSMDVTNPSPSPRAAGPTRSQRRIRPMGFSRPATRALMVALAGLVAMVTAGGIAPAQAAPPATAPAAATQPQSPHDQAFRDALQLMGEMTATLKGAVDESSAKAAAAKFEGYRQRALELMKQIGPDAPRDPAEWESLSRKYHQEIDQLGGAIGDSTEAHCTGSESGKDHAGGYGQGGRNGIWSGFNPAHRIEVRFPPPARPIRAPALHCPTAGGLLWNRIS